MLMLILSAIPMKPWAKPINWDTRATHEGDVFFPFASLVRLVPSYVSCPYLPQFSDLPLELQIHILSFCDSATLYQLMKVSSTIRAEAIKLFWSIPDVWYRVDCQWVFEGGLPGYASHAIDVLDYVQQIEICFTGYSLSTDRFMYDWVTHELHGGLPKRDQTKEEILHDFWKTLRTRFPCLKKVILDDYTSDTDDVLPENVQLMVELCPKEINVSASLLYWRGGKVNGQHRLERSLWKRVEDTNVANQWHLENSAWKRRSIMLPPKDFRGPVGELKRWEYLGMMHVCQRAAVRLLLIEARERHHFEHRYEPFKCLDRTCDARFEQPGEWALHAVQTDHDKVPEASSPPEEYKAAFEQLEKNLDLLSHEVTRLYTKAIHDIEVAGGMRRQKLEQEFLSQIEQDPLYEERRPADETMIVAQWKEWRSLDRLS